MGLDFTNIKDSDGAEIYILHHPSFTETRQFEQLQKDIETLPIVMVIADDDSILYQWSGDAIPAADVICSQLSRTNG